MFSRIAKKFGNKYQNISIESPDKLGSLNNISSNFAELDINMVYVKRCWEIFSYSRTDQNFLVPKKNLRFGSN